MLDPGPGERALGGVAQLVERLLCKQEVIGSIPFTSTSSCRMTGWWMDPHTAFNSAAYGRAVVTTVIRRLFDIVK